MNLRLKFSDERRNCRCSLDDDQVQNYGKLRRKIAEDFNAGDTSFGLSLNYGRNLLEADDNTTLQELGLVSGDVLTVMLQTDVMPTKRKSSPAPKNFKRSHTSNSNMDKVMLCSESKPDKIPLALKELYMSELVGSKFDMMVLLVHRLMGEVGFIQAEANNSKKLLSQWRIAEGVFSMKYSYPVCPSHFFYLSCIGLEGNILLINVVICDGPSKDTKMNIKLECDKYIKHFSCERSDPTSFFHDLPLLSKLFKDTIALPLLNLIRADAGLPTISDFMSLPVELKLKILGYLNGQSLVKVSEVCTDLNQLCKEDLLWKKCLIKEFSKDERGSYRLSTYKKKYVECVKIKRFGITKKRLLEGFHDEYLNHRPIPMNFIHYSPEYEFHRIKCYNDIFEEHRYLRLPNYLSRYPIPFQF